jgi:hypothetical protein
MATRSTDEVIAVNKGKEERREKETRRHSALRHTSASQGWVLKLQQKIQIPSRCN